MRCLLALLLLPLACAALRTQSLSTSRLVGTADMPLLIVNASQVGQPLRLLTGPGGATTGLELSSVGDVTIPLRLGVGSGVGAAGWERLRVGSLQATGGTGMTIDLAGTDSSTGLRLQQIGASGSMHAGLVITSASNGLGTGIRIGGPPSSGRPSLGTGIDIYGGTGLRYNALTDGGATAVVIGATTPPRRGIDVTVAGTEHVGGMFRSNMLGTGIVGVSMSGSYTDPGHVPRVGVRGAALTNSAVAADITIGVLGESVRGGLGGSNTTSIGIDALAQSMGSNNGGLAIGLRASAQTSLQGRSAAIGVLVDVAPEQGLAFAARRGNVYLGSDTFDVPLADTFTNGIMVNRSVTRLYDARISGMLGLVAPTSRVFMRPYAQGQVVLEWPARPAKVGSGLRVAGVRADTMQLAWTGGGDGMNVVQMPFNIPLTVNTKEEEIVRIIADNGGSWLAGLNPGQHGVHVTIMVVQGILTIMNEGFAAAEQDRIITPTLDAIVLNAPGYASFWYDGADHRWRLIRVTP
ncbi:MAG: hypothetical protein FGM24_06215 [Candidatus Kapabacteria bacterium]|nr:hypothetical protein [Candidatus Kapabacteria bacterium]